MNAVILAGGLGTRMKPMTETLPKWLLPVNGKPFAEFQLSYLASQGVRNILVCIAHQGEKIRELIPSGSPWGISLTYADEGKNLLGTAGALRKALDEGYLPEKFLLLYGDSFLPIDYFSFWKTATQNGFPATMTVLKNMNRWDKSNVAFDRVKNEIALYEKSEKFQRESGLVFDYIDYGLSWLTAATVQNLVKSQQKTDLAEVFGVLSRENRLGAYEVLDRFYEIGSPQGLAEFEEYIDSRK